jgi:hypothetical protein
VEHERPEVHAAQGWHSRHLPRTHAKLLGADDEQFGLGAARGGQADAEIGIGVEQADRVVPCRRAGRPVRSGRWCRHAAWVIASVAADLF